MGFVESRGIDSYRYGLRRCPRSGTGRGGGGGIIAQDEASSVVWACRAEWRKRVSLRLFFRSIRSRRRSFACFAEADIVTALDYEFLRRLLRECSGLVLLADKQYLVESRLLPVARGAGLAGLAELVQRLRSPNSQGLAAQVVEAMTTNKSFFFRDKIPFEHFRDTIMPGLIRRGRHDVASESGARLLLPARNPIRSPCLSRKWAIAFPAGASKSSQRIFRTRCWRRHGPESTANSRCNAGCRSLFC